MSDEAIPPAGDGGPLAKTNRRLLARVKEIERTIADLAIANRRLAAALELLLRDGGIEARVATSLPPVALADVRDPIPEEAPCV
jgi:hypothetical protein